MDDIGSEVFQRPGGIFLWLARSAPLDDTPLDDAVIIGRVADFQRECDGEQYPEIEDDLRALPPDAPTPNSSAPVIRPIDRARPALVFPGASASTPEQHTTNDAGAPAQAEPLATVVPCDEADEAEYAHAPNGAAAPEADEADQVEAPAVPVAPAGVREDAPPPTAVTQERFF
jgi:hypothetical protein